MAQILTSSTYKNSPAEKNQRVDQPSKEILYNPVNTVSLDIGFVLLVLALCGLFMPNFLGLNMSAMHCWVLASCGCIGIWSGLTTQRTVAMKLNFAVGIFFILNAILGVMAGEPGIEHGVINAHDELVIRIAPGFLELSTMDHVLHAVVGAFFLIEAFAWFYRVKHKNDVPRT